MGGGGRMRKVREYFASAFAAALLAVMLLVPLVLVLAGQGWQHPIQSLRSRAEMQSYLEEAYAGREFRVGFPEYNMIGNEFLAFVKDPEGQVLFGLSYTAQGGIAERRAFQGRDGRYYLTAEE